MANDEVIINIRERGARATSREVAGVSRSLGTLGTSSQRTSARAAVLGKVTSGLRHPFRYLSQEAIGLGKSVLGMGLAFGSVEGIKHSIETTDNLVKSTVQLRHQFGLTTESASTLAGVLQTRGISPMALRMGFVTLSKAMVGVDTGNKRVARSFGIVGLSTRDVKRQLHSSDGLSNVFGTVVDRLSKMPGGARKAATGQDLLGRASRGLAPLLMQGALGLRQQEKWARQFGVTLSDKTVGGVEDMAAAQTKAQYAALGLQIQMGQLLAPALTKVNLTFADVVKSFRDGRPEGNKYARTIYKIGQDLKPVGHDLALVGGYLKDHPRLLRLAALGFIGYKTKLLSLIGIAPKAYLSGLLAGRAYARGIETGATEGAGAGRLAMVGTRIGSIIGPAMGVAVAGYLGKQLLDKLENSFSDLLSAPTAGAIAADQNPAVRSARAWTRIVGKHHLEQKWMSRASPAMRRAHKQYLDLSTGPSAMTDAGRQAQAARSNRLGAYLRQANDPMFTPRTPADVRRVEQATQTIILKVDGKVLAKVLHRAEADKNARR